MNDKQIEEEAMMRFPDLEDKDLSQLMRTVWISGVKFGLTKVDNTKTIHIPSPLYFQ